VEQSRDAFLDNCHDSVENTGSSRLSLCVADVEVLAMRCGVVVKRCTCEACGSTPTFTAPRHLPVVLRGECIPQSSNVKEPLSQIS
jgi:hypothetical protein